MARCQFLQSIRSAFTALFFPKKEGAKLKPLESYRQFLIWLCIHPTDESSNKYQRLAYVAFTGTLHLCLLIESFVFCSEFWSIDLKSCMIALMIIVMTFASIYMLIIAIVTKRQKVAAIFEDLSTIYDTHENEESFRFLVKTNELCEWMLPTYFKVLSGATVTVVIASFASVVYCWWNIEHLNVKDFLHIIPAVFPWNQTTLLGYVFEVTILLLCCISYHIVTASFLLLFMSISLHHQAFYKMFNHAINKLNQSNAKWKVKCDAKFLCDRVRFQISLKNWFLDSVELYSPVVMVQMISNGAVMAVSTFNLDLQFQNFGFYAVIAVLQFLVGSSNALLYCYFGKIATESYEKMHNCLFELKWYKLPIESQKYFILMSANMQRSLLYHGFGVLHLNLETFTRMLRSVFSYYTVIKTITSK